MTEHVLDDDYHWHKHAERYYVAKKEWLQLIRSLERRSLFLILITAFALFIFFAFLIGLWSILIAIGYSIILGFLGLKKFARLKAMSEYSFTINNSEIIQHHGDNQKVVAFSDVEDVDFLEWGIELRLKASRSSKRNLLIPCEINNFNGVKSFFQNY